jgi:hypothetical protein
MQVVVALESQPACEAANSDNDGTRDAKELATKAGQSLLGLL